MVVASVAYSWSLGYTRLQPRLPTVAGEQLKQALVKNAGRAMDLFREWDTDGDGESSDTEPTWPLHTPNLQPLTLTPMPTLALPLAPTPTPALVLVLRCTAGEITRKEFCAAMARMGLEVPQQPQ